MELSWSPASVNWARLVRATLSLRREAEHGLHSSAQQRAAIVEQCLQTADDICSDDLNVARILCEEAYWIAQSLDPGSCAGVGALKFRTGIASVIAQKLVKKGGMVMIDREKDILNLWIFYVEYTSLLRADGTQLQPRKLWGSGTSSTEMGASDTEMETIYATLSVLLYVLEILVGKSPTDSLGTQILHEIRTIKDSDACSIVARYRIEHVMPEASQEPTNLPLTMLKDITNDFSDEREIGRGGYAVVYKGVLQDGIIAVKKLSNNHTIDDSAFYRETTFLMSVRHQNVVRFLGFCAHTEKKAMKWEEPQKYIYVELRERLLCFDYMREGSLSNHVADELRGLEWHTRFKIITGLCDGLCYLHKEKNIVHRDLKPGNVLLDDLMVPKIADFGISKFLEGVTHATTSNRTGSLGYCPLQFQRFGKVSLKTDVYSLGVMIVEIVTGYREDPNIKNVLRRWRYRWNKSGNYRPIAEEQIQKCIHVAVRCMDEDPNRRPYIWNIVDDLSEVEPTIGHTNLQNANEPIASHQVMPFPLEMLGIEPLEPHFPFEPKKQRTCSLDLTNGRGDNIGFRIDTIGPRKYHIEPNKGVVPPQSKGTVCITVQPHEKTPQGTLCKDEFVLWSTRVDEGLAAEDIVKATFDKEGAILEVSSMRLDHLDLMYEVNKILLYTRKIYKLCSSGQVHSFSLLN
uniref:Uncharacterized protein n=1 Tax=Avena sativa TaxID=4498 RepID=A0ACD6A6Z5_AVESA